jgi:hypothetical protein
MHLRANFINNSQGRSGSYGSFVGCVSNEQNKEKKKRKTNAEYKHTARNVISVTRMYLTCSTPSTSHASLVTRCKIFRRENTKQLVVDNS